MKMNALPYNIIPAGHSHPKIYGYGYSWSVGEDKGTFTEFASSSEVLRNWHPIGALDFRVSAYERISSVPARSAVSMSAK